MGTHPSCPAYYETQLLSDLLKGNSNLVGTVPEGYTNNDLPFLFKVLSIKTALSIQVTVLIRMHDANKSIHVVRLIQTKHWQRI